MPLITLNPPRSNPRGRSSSRPSSSSALTPSSSRNNPPPPPPPPLPFDQIIARAYGPTINIYKDIFRVSPDAYQNEIRDAYNRVRDDQQVKLDKLSAAHNHHSSKNKALLRKKLLMQRDAAAAAYRIVSNPERRKKYDKVIGLELEHPTVVVSSAKKTKDEHYVTATPEYVNDLFEDDEIFGDKFSTRRKLEYPKPSSASATLQRKIAVVSPNNRQCPDDEVDEIIAPSPHMTSPLDRLRTTHDKERQSDECNDDASSLDCLVNSPTAVSELFDHSHKAHDDDDETSYTSLHASGKKQKSRHSRNNGTRGLSSSRRQRGKKKGSHADHQDGHDCEMSDEESFAYEEEDAEACVDLIALYLNSCPCVQMNNDDDDEESVLYD